MTENNEPKLASTNITTATNARRKFVRMDSEWWTWPALKLEGLNEVRIPAMIKVLVETGRINRDIATSSKPLVGIRILDVGCHDGILTEPLAKLGAEVVGLDASDKLIETAKRRAKDQQDIVNNIEYVCTTVQDYCESNVDKFDHVTATELMEHLDDREQFVKCCVKTIKPNGTILLSTINRTMKAWYTVTLMQEYILRLVPWGTYTYNKFLTPEEVQTMLENNNCSVHAVVGWNFNTSTGIWNRTVDTSVSYCILALKEE